MNIYIIYGFDNSDIKQKIAYIIQLYGYDRTYDVMVSRQGLLTTQLTGRNNSSYLHTSRFY